MFWHENIQLPIKISEKNSKELIVAVGVGCNDWNIKITLLWSRKNQQLLAGLSVECGFWVVDLNLRFDILFCSMVTPRAWYSQHIFQLIGRIPPPTLIT